MNEQTKFKMVAWLIVAVALAAVLCLGGCNEKICRPTAWLMTGPDIDDESNIVTGRVGVLNADGIEFGGEISYLQGIKENNSYLAYALQQFTIVDIGTQYIGGKAGIIDSDESGNVYGFIAGEVVPITERIDAVVETQFAEYDRQIMGTDDDWTVTAGLRVRF